MSGLTVKAAVPFVARAMEKEQEEMAFRIWLTTDKQKSFKDFLGLLRKETTHGTVRPVTDEEEAARIRRMGDFVKVRNG
jgi:hypothetical protein